MRYFKLYVLLGKTRLMFSGAINIYFQKGFLRNIQIFVRALFLCVMREEENVNISKEKMSYLFSSNVSFSSIK